MSRLEFNETVMRMHREEYDTNAMTISLSDLGIKMSAYDVEIAKLIQDLVYVYHGLAARSKILANQMVK